jgi:signal transduction histidine kinase
MTMETINNKMTTVYAEQYTNKWKSIETNLQEQAAFMEEVLNSLRSLSLSTTYSENIAKMASSITHEVRNPLTTVSGFLQLIKQTNNLETIHQYTDIALGELTRANELITDFLSLSKSQENEMMPLSINELIKNLYPVFQSDANLKGINLHVDLSTEDLLCIANKQHLTQIIVNIVKNAFEAVEENNASTSRTVTIKTHVSMENLFLIVKDNGCGITDAQLNSLFTPLQTTKKYGTGMGLFVCKQLVEKYNGKITVESSISKGTTISIQFPICFS